MLSSVSLAQSIDGSHPELSVLSMLSAITIDPLATLDESVDHSRPIAPIVSRLFMQSAMAIDTLRTISENIASIASSRGE